VRQRLNDAASALLRAVRAAIPLGPDFVLEEIRSRSWSSATFAGARHDLVFRLEGEDAEKAAGQFLAGLDPAALALRGHLLAGISLVSEERTPGRVRIGLEALTVEDG
jgi:hypothetical protein